MPQIAQIVDKWGILLITPRQICREDNAKQPDNEILNPFLNLFVKYATVYHSIQRGKYEIFRTFASFYTDSPLIEERAVGQDILKAFTTLWFFTF